MATLKAVKRRIVAVQKTQQVTKAMKMVSAAKMKKSTDRMMEARPYSARIREMLEHLLPGVDRSVHPLLDIRDIQKRAYVVITGDRGLCGSFNSRIIKRAEEELRADGGTDARLICVGRKGHDHFQKRGYNVIGSFTQFFNDLNFEHAAKITRMISDLYMSQGLDEVKVIYNQYRNVLVQELTIDTYLPLRVDAAESESFRDFLFEPSAEDIVTRLVEKNMATQMWQYLLESNASEQSARMVAMDNATTNAEDMIKSLQLKYNKTRQAAITSEILEVVSGAEAMKNA